MSMRTFLTTLLMSAVACSGESESNGIDRRVNATSQPIQAAVKANNAIAKKLASALRDEPGNLFYSPLSIEALSGMLLAGAGEEAAAQLNQLLGAPRDRGALHAGLGALVRDLSQQHTQYSLSVAHRLWAAPSLDPSRAFKATMRENYAASLERLDFATAPESARNEINQWVSRQTAGEIPELLLEGQVTADTVMAVVSAIYFKADWSKAFDASLTKTDTFHKADGSDTSVEMMTLRETKVRTRADGEARWLELPYLDGDVSFLAYTKESKPDSPPYSVQQLQADLQKVAIEDAVAQLDEIELTVQMPRFTLRSRLDLVPVFKQLGVTDLFDAQHAELTKIDENAPISIKPFVHEAALVVDEQGSTATAATSGVTVLSLGPPTLRLDHPFLFVIRDNLTDAILFSGQLADPSGDSSAAAR